MTKVVIEVRGGVVIGVYASSPIEYTVVDWDSENPEDIRVLEADAVRNDMHGIFAKIGETEIAESLKLNEF